MTDTAAKIKKQFERQSGVQSQRWERGKRIVGGFTPMVKAWPVRKEHILKALADLKKTSRQKLSRVTEPIDTGRLERRTRQLGRAKFLMRFHWRIWKAKLKIAGLAILFAIGITLKTIVEAITAVIRSIVKFFKAVISAIIRSWLLIMLILILIGLLYFLFSLKLN